MGEASVHAITHETDMTVVAQTDKGDDLADAISRTKANVVLDFTHPSVVKENVLTILRSKVHAVVGTTGLSEADLKDLDAVAKENSVSVIVCPNFAIGAILMMRFAQEASKYMSRVEIIEYHHDKKADAPSGTAIKTAEMIHETNPHINKRTLEEKEIIEGARGGAKHGIPIHAVRVPGFVANQEVIFGGLGQTLTIKHDTISRESFMPGVVLALRKAVNRNGLTYGLENLL